MSRCPRLLLRFCFRMRTVSPTTSKMTSVLGNSPSLSRMSCGIVTCPFDVTRISPLLLLPILLLRPGDRKTHVLGDFRIYRRLTLLRPSLLLHLNTSFTLKIGAMASWLRIPIWYKRDRDSARSAVQE